MLVFNFKWARIGLVVKSKHTFEEWFDGSYRKYLTEGTLNYIDLKPYGLPWADLWPDKYSEYFKGRRGVLDMSGFY